METESNMSNRRTGTLFWSWLIRGVGFFVWLIITFISSHNVVIQHHCKFNSQASVHINSSSCISRLLFLVLSKCMADHGPLFYIQIIPRLIRLKMWSSKLERETTRETTRKPTSTTTAKERLEYHIRIYMVCNMKNSRNHDVNKWCV